MNYYGRYGLEYNPFIKNSKEILVETNEYQEIVARLNYLVETHGFGLITGMPGLGKTTTVRNWSRQLNPSKYKLIYISISTLTVIEFYRNLAEQLNIETKFRKTDNFKVIQAEINRLTLEKKITPIIILDEANYLGNGILNDLKMLFNFEMDSRDRVVLLFVGLPQLNTTLRLANHEPLRQRIIMNYQMEGIAKEEGKGYIEKKLKAAGSQQPVFEDAAIEAILNYANGSLRVVNSICDKALMVGDLLKQDVITTDCIMKAVDEYEIS